MVDREARGRAGELLEEFGAGTISNDGLERDWPRSKDNAVREIRKAVWHLYSDLREHQLERSPAGQDLIRRCIDFLRTDLEYRWPVASAWLVAASVPLGILTLGLSNRLLWRGYSTDAPWPFPRDQRDIEVGQGS